MSNISSTDTRPVKLMRWVARFLSIPWAFWALFWTFFVAMAYHEGEGYFGLPVFIIIMAIAVLMFIGAAIIASVWGKEALGGGVLLVDGMLIYALGVYGPHSPMPTGASWDTVLAISTLVLAPLVAGSLFLACHRISKTSGEQHV